MRPPLRILDTGLAPAGWNVAMTAALVEANAPRPGETVVRFHRYPPCVLLGIGQDAAQAADLDYCRAAGIDIVRRVTGGGAVYMSPGMLAWDVLVDRRELGGDLARITARICSGVAAGLARLGTPARFRPPNDIEIGGRKVSGSAGYTAGEAAVLQGTVLIADEVPAMARALRLADAALRARVTCLAAEMGAAPGLQAVTECITLGLAEALGRAPTRDRLRRDEIALCEGGLGESTLGEGAVRESAPDHAIGSDGAVVRRTGPTV